MIELSIIIVNWNSADYLRKCLASVFKNMGDLDLEVIVVDNASYDGCATMLYSEFPSVRFIQSGSNLGFARANNLGFSRSSGENLLFLNPDTEVVEDALFVMLKYLQTLSDAGAVGCKLLNTDGSVQTSCVQPFPTVLNQFLDTDYLILRFPKIRMWGVRPLFLHSGAPEPVEVISGACIMIKRHVFEKAGRFSVDYFMYGEDLDLCYKIRSAGFKAYYVGDARIVHHGGTSTGRALKNHLNTVVKRESVMIFMKKYRGEWAAKLYRISSGFASIIRMGIIILLFPAGLVFGRLDTLYGTLEKWTKVLRWSLGLEKWAARLG